MKSLCVLFVSFFVGTALSSFANFPSCDNCQIITPQTSLGPEDFVLNESVVIADPPDGCSPPDNVAEITGRIVLVAPNGCYPRVKAKNMQDANASGVALTGYRKTPGLLYYYRSYGEESQITIPTVEISQKDSASIKANIDSNVIFEMIIDTNPMVNFGEILWIFYTVILGLYNFIILFTHGKKLADIIKEQGTTHKLPIMVLGLNVFTCALRIPLLIDPNATRGVWSWSVLEFFFTLDFAFAITSNFLIAFHWDIAVRSVHKGLTISLGGKYVKVTGFCICGILLVLELATSAMRAALLAAQLFLIIKVLWYIFSAAILVAAYFIYVWVKIRKSDIGDIGGNKNFKKKVRITLFIATSLILFVINICFVPTPLYSPPAGYFMFRFFAAFFLYTAVLFHPIIFDSGDKKGYSATTGVNLNTRSDSSSAVD